ncbi:IPT/TIG domain-containing protein [Pseudoscourfieldia marina]
MTCTRYGADAGGAVVVSGGAGASGDSGDVIVLTPDAGTSGVSGALSLTSGASTAGRSGSVSVVTGDASGGAAGDFTVSVHVTTGSGGNPEMIYGPKFWKPPPRGLCTRDSPWCAFQSGYFPRDGQMADFTYSRLTVHNATHLDWEQWSSIDHAVIDRFTVVQPHHGPFEGAGDVAKERHGHSLRLRRLEGRCDIDDIVDRGPVDHGFVVVNKSMIHDVTRWSEAGPSATYTEGTGKKVLDSSNSANDADSFDLQSATIQNTPNFDSTKDFLAFCTTYSCGTKVLCTNPQVFTADVEIRCNLPEGIYIETSVYITIYDGVRTSLNTGANKLSVSYPTVTAIQKTGG